MPSLILPSRFTVQPPAATGIDTGNPLTNGLLDVYNGASPLFLSSNRQHQALTLAGSIPPSYLPTAVGPSFDSTTSIVSRNSASLVSSSEGSLLVFTTPTNTSAATRSMFGYGNSANANTLFFIGQGVSAGQLSFWSRSDGGSTQNLQVSPSNWAQGVPSVLIGTRSESQNFHRLYCNGISQSPTAATVLGTSTFNRTSIGGLMRASAGLMYPGSVYLAASWNRALSASEVASLTENPWQIFKPTNRRVWVVGLGGTDATVTITGVSSSSSTGVLVVSASSTATPAGLQSLLSTGTISVNAASNVLVVGRALTSSLGTISPRGSASPALSGVFSSFNTGTISVATGGSISVPVTGISIASSTGIVAASASSRSLVSGYSISSAVGNIQPKAAATVNVLGTSSTITVGNISVSIGAAVSVSVSGVQAGISVGVISPSSGSTCDVIGNILFSSTGSLTGSGSSYVLLDGLLMQSLAGDIRVVIAGAYTLNSKRKSTAILRQKLEKASTLPRIRKA